MDGGKLSGINARTGGAGGMGVDGIGEVGDRASKGQAAWVYGAGFTAGEKRQGGDWE